MREIFFFGLLWIFVGMKSVLVIKFVYLVRYKRCLVIKRIILKKYIKVKKKINKYVIRVGGGIMFYKYYIII